MFQETEKIFMPLPLLQIVRSSFWGILTIILIGHLFAHYHHRCRRHAHHHHRRRQQQHQSFWGLGMYLLYERCPILSTPCEAKPLTRFRHQDLASHLNSILGLPTSAIWLSIVLVHVSLCFTTPSGLKCSIFWLKKDISFSEFKNFLKHFHNHFLNRFHLFVQIFFFPSPLSNSARKMYSSLSVSFTSTNPHSSCKIICCTVFL